MSYPSAVRIREVGPRDGIQSEKAQIATEDKIRLIDSLSATGLRFIEAVSFVSPKAVPSMAGAAEVMAGIDRRDDVTYAALVPNVKGAELALAAGVDELTVTVPSTGSPSRCTRTAGCSCTASRSPAIRSRRPSPCRTSRSSSARIRPRSSKASTASWPNCRLASSATAPANPAVLSYSQLVELWRSAGSAYGVPWQVLGAINVGLAPHSVRAVPLEWLKAFTVVKSLPVHMHVAEQPAEVEACIAEHGRSPVALLDSEGLLSERFTGVHVIHITAKAARMIAAVEHPLVDCLGHPSGRMLLRREGYDFDIEAVAETAARSGTMIEINGNPNRRDLSEQHARLAAEAGVMIVLNTDAHGVDTLDNGLLASRLTGPQGLDVPVAFTSATDDNPEGDLDTEGERWRLSDFRGKMVIVHAGRGEF